MKHRFIRSNLKGFTLVEIMVVLSIIIILGGITISGDYRTNKIRNSIMIDTESIATDIRDMQNRTASFVQNTSFNNVGYGVFFDIKNPLKTETFYKLNGDFDITEVLNSNSLKPTDDFILSEGNYIKRICLNGCYNKIINPNGKLAIFFVKPKPYVNFSYSDDGLTYYKNLYPIENAITHACVEIKSQNNLFTKRIDIYYIGQISYSYGSCEN